MPSLSARKGNVHFIFYFKTTRSVHGVYCKHADAEMVIQNAINI